MNEYLYVATTEHAMLRRAGVHDAKSLFTAIETFATARGDGVPRQVNNFHTVYRKSMVAFLRKKLKGAFIDLFKLSDDGIVRLGGAFPRQWVSLRLDRAASLTFTRHMSAEVNGNMDEDEALKLALSLSTLDVDPIVPIDPEDLVCPITLELMKDPVRTDSGRVFERYAITAWLTKSKTDPLTGESISDTLVADERIRRMVKGF
jgi:hypothetical protein